MQSFLGTLKRLAVCEKVCQCAISKYTKNAVTEFVFLEGLSLFFEKELKLGAGKKHCWDLLCF